MASIVLFIIWLIFISKNKTKDSDLKAWNIIRYAWWKSKKHTVRYLLWFWIYILLSIISWFFDAETSILANVALSFLIVFATQLLMVWITLWLTKISLDIVYDRQYKVKSLFVWVKTFFRFILAYILKILIIIAWYILLIIPGIIRTIRLNFVSHLILEKNLSPIKAIKTSWKMTKWLVWNILWINMAVWLINILGVLCLLVWLIWTIPVVIIANAYLYKKILELDNTNNQK
jgi:uncharacterized membrane protein